VATVTDPAVSSTVPPATGLSGHGRSVRCGPGQPGDAVSVPESLEVNEDGPDDGGPVLEAQPAASRTSAVVRANRPRMGPS
jgi:hypothetical protein